MVQATEATGLSELTFNIQGVAPLIQHNGQLKDPCNEWAKSISKITGKRKKTEEDRWAIARLEFLAGLYVNDDGRVILPSDVIEAVILTAAKKRKLGRAFKPAVFVYDDAILEYEGPKDAEKMWDSGKFNFYKDVKIGQSSVMRMRPRFEQWSAQIKVMHYPALIDAEDIVDVVAIGGVEIGFCDWRPKFGRYVVLNGKS